ncbi:MAG TPA: hypothetical protein VF236_04315 [Gaiellaceae bacterium]
MAEDTSTNLTLDDVMEEQDSFRLGVLGFALIEDSMASGIAEAFEGTMPSELKRVPFKARLALFSAVTATPERFVKPLLALAKLRNDFAHGRLNNLTQHRANSLADELRKPFPKSAQEILEGETPHELLASCIWMCAAIVDACRNSARKRRDKEQEAESRRGARRAASAAGHPPAVPRAAARASQPA